MKKLESLVRSHMLNLSPYSSARDEFKGQADIFLDANENAYGSLAGDQYHRYPDPYQDRLKRKIGRILNIDPSHLFLGNGSDEPIDLLIRLFCNPGMDNVIVNPPTYDMYAVAATVNDVEVRRATLKQGFQLDTEKILGLVNDQTKIIFLCSPNNPTGNSMNRQDILLLLDRFEGIIVVDEAYIDFSPHKSLMADMKTYPNLVVLQTLSKAWGLAGLRLGLAIAAPDIIKLLSKIKYPYNINQATQQLVLDALDHSHRKEKMVNDILEQKAWLTRELESRSIVEEVYPSDANFLLVKFKEAASIFHYLLSNKIIVRNRSHLVHCEESLRITVGTEQENSSLINSLEKYQPLK